MYVYEWLLGLILSDLARIEFKLDLLDGKIGRVARAEKERDERMSAETQAAIDELEAEVGPMGDAVQAVAAAIDGLIAQVEAAGDDPAEIREVIASFKSNRDALVAAALKGTPAGPVEPVPA